MIALLTGVGAALCVFLLALMASKQKHTLGDGWLCAWLGLYLGFFACLAATQILAAPGAALLAALLGQCAAAALAPAQFLHAWALTGGAARAGFGRAAWALLLIGAIVALPLAAPIELRAGAIVVDGVAPWLLAAPPIAMLAMMAYPIMALRRLHVYRARLKQRLSNLYRAGLDWTRAWAYSTLALLAAQAGVYFVSLTGALSVPLHVSLLICAQATQIAYVGWRGLAHTHVFAAEPADEAAGAPGKAELEAARADSAQLSVFMAARQPHLDSELTAAALADQIGWAPDRLTRALRFGAGANFHDFVNRARVETVKQLAREPRHARTTLLSLALDAGFGSKSAFYAAFRAAEGMTPARWRAANRQN